MSDAAREGSEVGTQPDPAATCARLADGYCPRLDACSSFFMQFAFGDIDTCKQRIGLLCKRWLTAPGNAAAASVDACIASAPTLSCSALLAGNGCVLAGGTLELGAPCGDGSQCKSAFCAVADANGCGTCAAPPREGAPCVSTQCESHMICGPDGTCFRPRALGEACARQGECAMPLSCNAGHCGPPAMLGAMCDPTGASAPDCDFTAGTQCFGGTCGKVGLASTGEKCGASMSSLTLCKAGGSCQAPGTCHAVAADGAPCDEMRGIFCLGPARCLGGVCKVVDPGACR